MLSKKQISAKKLRNGSKIVNLFEIVFRVTQANKIDFWYATSDLSWYLVLIFIHHFVFLFSVY